MAKKDKQIEFKVEEESKVVENILEADAYGSPKPDEGADVTVLKQVGIGGPVPIVAPKHNTIQLQPIVVPLAVVPYMTQDSNVLRTDGKPVGEYGDNVEGEETEFSSVRAKKEKKKGKLPVLTRVFSLIMFIMSGIMIIPFIMAALGKNFGAFDASIFNIIQIMKGWGSNFAWWHVTSVTLLLLLAGVSIVITVLTTFIGTIVGKFARPMNWILMLIDTGIFTGIYIFYMVSPKWKDFYAAKDIRLVVFMLAFSVVSLIAAVIFTVVLNKKEDKSDKEKKANSKI